MHANENKKNARSILVIALLVVLVATLAFGGYSLAKYVESQSESGSASVAKWGYEVEITGGNLFGEKYAFASNNSTVTNDNASLTVKASSSGTNVVAPGTSGSMTFKVTGNAEVAAKLEFKLENTTDICLTYGDNKTYNPIKWTLKKTSGAGETLVDGATLADVATAINAKGDTYDPANAAVEETYELSWVWDFENNAEITGTTYNDLDTTLGMLQNDAGSITTVKGTNLAVDKNNTKTDIAFDLTISVVQLSTRS